MNRILSIALLLVVPAAVLAQTSSQSQQIVRLQPGMSWHVEELEKTDSILGSDVTDNQGRLIERGSVGSDHRRREFVSSQGEWIDQYITRDFVLTKQPDGSFSLEHNDEIEESNAPRLRVDRLGEFFWMTGLEPSGRMKVDEVDCDIYFLSFEGLSVDPTSAGRAGIRFVAAVGTRDRFPRRLETPERVLRFVPQPKIAPTSLPPGAVVALKEYAEILRKKTEQYLLPR